MRLVEIAKGVSVNPDHVTSVRLEERGFPKKEFCQCVGPEGDTRSYKAGDKRYMCRKCKKMIARFPEDMDKRKMVVVYLTEIDGDRSDNGSIMYSTSVMSKYNYEDTLKKLRGTK